MAASQSIINYLSKTGIDYRVMPVTPFASVREAVVAAGVPLGSLARGSVMMDHLGPVMVVVPATDDIDVDALNALLGRKVAPASQWQISKIFKDCDSRFLPAMGDAFGVRTLIDERLIAQGHQRLHIFGGDNAHLLGFDRGAFLNLQAKAWFAQGLAGAGDDQGDKAVAGRSPGSAGAPETVRAALARADALPVMPGLAHEILKLHADPDADAAGLARLVQLDPGLAAQIMRYAAAPFFGYRGRVDSLHTAISRVLGYDMVMNLALGIALAKPFKLPRQGALGLLSFWRHAVYSAATMQVLGREMPRAAGVRAGTSYLAGLLHNFGLVVVGHVFRQEYQQIGALSTAQPHRPLIELERQVLGMDHGALGARVLEHWGLPEEVVVTAREHHNADYRGPHARYAALALLTDRLLMNYGIGDAAETALPPHILSALDMDEVKALSVMNRILQGCAGLDTMARQLAA